VSVWAGPHQSYAVAFNKDSKEYELWRWGLVEENPSNKPLIIPVPTKWTGVSVDKTTRLSLGQYYGIVYNGTRASTTIEKVRGYIFTGYPG
jgi:hypothetical protein